VGSLLRDQRDPSGFLYRRNRYYDPFAGRFTQPDPIGLAGGLNLYGFAGGDPVNFADPFGLQPFETWLNLLNRLGRAVIAQQILSGNTSGATPLATIPAGTRIDLPFRRFTGLNVIAETDLGIRPDPVLNTVVAARGAVEVNVSRAPDPVITEGYLNLGTGDFVADIWLTIFPFVSGTARGNIKTKELRVCIVGICKRFKSFPPASDEQESQ
jgi:RHS repeat-associated protein